MCTEYNPDFHISEGNKIYLSYYLIPQRCIPGSNYVVTSNNVGLSLLLLNFTHRFFFFKLGILLFFSSVIEKIRGSVS